MSHISEHSDYLSPFERQDYLARLHAYIAQVLDGTLPLQDVPYQYLDDVITTGFYEFSGHKMTIDQYIRYSAFHAYLQSRHSQEGIPLVISSPS